MASRSSVKEKKLPFESRHFLKHYVVIDFQNELCNYLVKTRFYHFVYRKEIKREIVYCFGRKKYIPPKTRLYDNN